MPAQTTGYENITEAVGLFHSPEDMQAAIDDLLTQGFNRAELSIMASEETIAKKLHGNFASVRDLEDRADVPTTAYVAHESLGAAEGAVIGSLVYVPAVLGASAVVASGGALAAAVAAAAIYGGVGAALGSLFASIIGKNAADQISDHLAVGGLLLWVRTRDIQHQERAMAIMQGHNAEDAHVHTLPSLSPGGVGMPVEEAVDTDGASSG
jgi:hypothetical protein